MTSDTRRGVGGLVKSVLLGAGVTISSMIGGCEAPRNGNSSADETALLGLILLGTGYTNNNPGAAAVGDGMLRYGAAQTGRSNINQNTYITTPNQPVREVPIAPKKELTEWEYLFYKKYFTEEGLTSKEEERLKFYSPSRK